MIVYAAGNVENFWCTVTDVDVSDVELGDGISINPWTVTELPFKPVYMICGVPRGDVWISSRPCSIRQLNESP